LAGLPLVGLGLADLALATFDLADFDFADLGPAGGAWPLAARAPVRSSA
jgi:hypothetical protein